MLKPCNLNPGDKVAAGSPSWRGPSVFARRYQIGVQPWHREFGLPVVEMPNTLKAASWLARNPKARAGDLMQAFADPFIKGIFATLGGDDSIRLLAYMDLNVIRDNPKIFMGYSDTIISHWMCYKAGLASFFGPSLLVEFAENGGMFPYVVQSLQRTLFSSEAIGEIKQDTKGRTIERLEGDNPKNQNIKRKPNPSTGWKFMQGSGLHRGHLIGACLEVFDWTRGTELFPQQWQDPMLFLETSEEAPAPDRVMRTLRIDAAMGILSQLSEILFGRPDDTAENFAEHDHAILYVVRDEEGFNHLPLITHMDFGHTSPMFVVPYGLQAEIDCDQQRFSMIENAVVD